MRHFIRLLCVFSLAVSAAFTLPGCHKSVSRSSGNAGYTVTKDGKSIVNRNVKYSVDGGSGSVTATGDKAHLTLAGVKITVEADRILLDDKEVAKIAPETKEVDIDSTNGVLTIKADGAKVHEAKVAK